MPIPEGLQTPQRLEIPDRNANPKRVTQVYSDAERIAKLEAQIQQLLESQRANAPTAEHGYLASGEEVPDAAYPYENPREFDNVLVLSTGELVGTSGVQSTEHWSRTLQRNVKVTSVL